MASESQNETRKAIKLPLHLLEGFTDGFSKERIVGERAYGTVYRGDSPTGKQIAVKMFYNHDQGPDDEQFRNELHNHMSLEHQNIVRLVGYCYETQHKHTWFDEKLVFAETINRALCFEYMPNGSLQKHILDESEGLDWHTRYKIIKGTCEGLKYLHEELKPPMYHLDIKPDNILLDKNMEPKLADFCLSTLFDGEQTRITSSLVGKPGYAPPEYLLSGIISKKFDIFSLGVVIVKIVAGPTGYSKCAEMPFQEFIDLVHRNWRKRLQVTWSGSSLEAYGHQVNICTAIALSCVEADRHKRPDIVDIINKLNEVESLIDGLRNDNESALGKAEMSSWLGVTSPMEACMSSSLGAMGPVLRKLDSLLLPEYWLSKPLQDGIRLLKEDLEEISSALEEQSTVHSPNEISNYWMNEVREISYDIDDFLDDMMLRHTDTADTKIRYVRRHRVGRVKTAWRSKTLKPCTRAAKIAELRAIVREASERHDMYLDGCTSSPRCVFTTGHGQTPALYAVAANYLVGIDYSKTNLVQLLTNETEQQLKVVAIVGPAGVGKTTLANQVYRELEEQFECRAFVRASRKPDMARLLAGILSQVQQCSGPSDSCTVQDLIDNLKKHLQDKRYVIVIDDLWETIAWDIVTSAFPEGNNCSRIVTMAQIEGVALECCDYQSNNILKMKPLGREDSRKLFFNMVFGSESSCPEQLKEVSDIAITKCAGLPLATICVAGLLASQPDNSEVWQHVQGYLCSSLSTNSTLEETLQEILKLSYNSLPRYLKTCLMYLGMYPEGYTMWKDDLVKQWVAECFISATEGQDREEVAESYFDELVNRGMIQPVEISYNDEVLSCTVHQVVLDLIAHKSNEEKFITALDYSQTITGLYRKDRRLSLHFSNTRYATKPTALALSQVRSLAFFGMLKCMPSIVKFKLLRVLVLEFWGDLVGCTSFDLTGVCGLFQLRYLKISGDASIEVELPAQMRRLKYLETLKINARVSAVPLDLPGLLHLSLGDETKVPYGIGSVRSLRTLEYFDLGKNSKKSVLSLSELINLQDLHLTYSTVNSPELLKRKLAALASSIAELVNLKSVTLAPGALDTAIYHDCSSSMSSPQVFLQRLELLSPICIFSRLPEWIGQLRKLCILKVVISELQMKDMNILTGLPALTVLVLYVRQPTAESIIFKRGAFPALKCFNYRCGVVCLAFQEEALPNLQRLELHFNAHREEQYAHLLAGIEHLPNLKEIAGTIGAAAGAEEPDRRAAESALKDAIRKHPRFPSYDSVKRVDRVDEEYGPQVKQNSIREEDPSSEPGILEKTSVECIKQNPDSDFDPSGMYSHFVCRELVPGGQRHQHRAQLLQQSGGGCGGVRGRVGGEGCGRGRSVFAVECVPLWGFTSTCGRRPEMRDAGVAVSRFFDLPLWMLTGNAMVDGLDPLSFRLPAHFFGVYDGHGSAQVANYCRDRLHVALVEELRRIEGSVSSAELGAVDFKQQLEKAFVDCFSRVDDEVGGKANRGGGRSVSTSDAATEAVVEHVAPETVGSTALVAVICSSHIIVANCGDSRVVLCRGKEAVPLSVDHKPDREDEMARIEAEGGRIIQWDGYRVFGVLNTSRSIGCRFLKPFIVPVPEVTIVPRAQDDECLILASDGLWDALSNEQVCDIARKRILLWHKKNENYPYPSSAQQTSDSTDPAAQGAAECLSKLALQKGSKDNVTVIVVDLKAQRRFKTKLPGPQVVRVEEDRETWVAISPERDVTTSIPLRDANSRRGLPPRQNWVDDPVQYVGS